MLEIFVEKFLHCQKARESLVVYWLKRYFIVYLWATSLVTTIWLVADFQANHEQIHSIEKQLPWKLKIRISRPEVFCKTGFWNFCKIHKIVPVPASPFQKDCRLLGESICFKEYVRTTASARYPLEKLIRKFLKNSQENTLEKVLF